MAEENQQVLFVVEALIGAVSWNWRRVALEVEAERVLRLWFLLEQDLLEDREEIEDVVFEVEAQEHPGWVVEFDIAVDSRPFEELRFPRRIVYSRRE